ncbi:hypothetical protein SAMN05421638_2091 [Kaistella treverensis]|uniref:Lipoprotein n=1 Tax=Kaistella treverensis TaxID=631455 RepID=A0A1I3NIU4_9FLAO|nr:hypothetical protein [Kaistella treverensis]SFJ08676.1 hypothetical protein SAMN05421638_2091 [Kaistella treverensis]
MKHLIYIPLVVFTLFSCKAKKGDKAPETLPKDIALKPENNYSQQLDRERLAVLVKEIDSLAGSEICTDAAEWRSSPIGAKPCGGPSSYIAYPIKMEDEILAKIKEFTAQQDAFNKKYQLMSDCAMVPPPAGIQCENGKAVLVKSDVEVVQ